MIKPSQIYKHFKGNTYKILLLAKDSETCEDVVVYQNVETNAIWARPSSMFTDSVEHEGATIKRYALIQDDTGEA